MAIELEKHEKRWLKNVFFALNDLAKPSSIGLDNIDDFNSTVRGKLQIAKVTSPDVAWQAVQSILDTLDSGQIKNIDSFQANIRVLADSAKYFDKDDQDYKQITGDQAIIAIAAMCAINNITFDWSNFTSFEVEKFYRTDFGREYARAMQENGTPVALPSKSVRPAAPASSAPASRHANVSVPGVSSQTNQVMGKNGRPMTHGNAIKPSVHTRSVPRKDPTKVISDYKSAGSFSPYLRGKLGNKRDIVPDVNNYIYRIEAKDSKTSGNTPVAFVKPIDIDIQDKEGKKINTAAKNVINGTNKVFFGSAHGYPEAMLFWDDLAQADSFLTNLLASNRIPSKIDPADVKVYAVEVKGAVARIVTHQFYPIDTEFGPALICANMLNESLNEAFGTTDIDFFSEDPIEEELTNTEVADNTQVEPETTEFTKDDFSAFVRENVNWN